MIMSNPDYKKEINRLLKELVKRNLAEDRSGKKHLKFMIKGVGLIVMPSSPSDERGVTNSYKHLLRLIKEGMSKGSIPPDFPVTNPPILTNPPKVTAVLSKQRSGPKKYKIVFTRSDGKTKTLYFGDSTREDYTIHGDTERKRRYLARHKARENWNDPMTPGALSKWLLWNKLSLKASVSDYSKRFGIPVKILGTFTRRDLR